MRILILVMVMAAAASAMKWHREHAQVEGRDFNLAYRFIDLGAADGSTTIGTKYEWFWIPDNNETRRVWMGDAWTVLH